MTTKKTFVIITIALISLSFKGGKKAYVVFDDLGGKSNYEKILKKAEKADIILFGELHNNPISHWLELELTKDIFEQINPNIVLGAEMFEADDQLIINEYLGGHYSYNTFKKEAKLWPNNSTDYQPLLDFALGNQLTFIATNVPRRYANMVYKGGFKAFNHINDEAKKYIAPLPIKYDKNLPGYKKIVKMAGGHGGDNLPKAQAVKDATMAHFILKNYREGSTFIHYNGSYHSNNFEGIMWYLKQANPDLKILTINCVEQKELVKLEEDNKSTAHFIIAIPETMTKTY
ncbi:MAG: ChaN family lipoprotein [Flavobacteriales bacterium]|nr:ChaN family lipoprotein [Flavobacteriales bacterium]NQX98035.1 ChaN family lipoprotein [Flavobacteriales bacterium]